MLTVIVIILITAVNIDYAFTNEPDAVLYTSHITIYTTTLRGRRYYSHFIDEETETQCS